MSQEQIINKVAESGLIQFDPSSLSPKGERILFDLKDWLYEETILKEKDFRQALSSHDWSQYSGKHVSITCTADAIIPTWAYMLIATQLEGIAARIVLGDLRSLEEELYREAISRLDADQFREKRIVIKGCGGVPDSVYVDLLVFFKPLAKSVMFGEPCSTVPVYKKPS